MDINKQRKIISTNRIFQYWNITLHNSKVQKFLMDTSQQFDAAIVEWLYTDIGSG